MDKRSYARTTLASPSGYVEARPPTFSDIVISCVIFPVMILGVGTKRAKIAIIAIPWIPVHVNMSQIGLRFTYDGKRKSGETIICNPDVSQLGKIRKRVDGNMGEEILPQR